MPLRRMRSGPGVVQDFYGIAVEDRDGGAGEVGGKYHRYEARADGERRGDQTKYPLHLNHY